MDMHTLRNFFLWCTLINAGLLVVGALAFLPLRDMIYRIHGKFFPMSRETFNAVFYALIGAYKIVIFVFNLVPWLVLTVIL